MSAHHPEPLREFPCVIELPVQWGDQDAIGHVNNVVPLRWFESARIAYFEQIGVDDVTGLTSTGLILASNHCNYRRQVNYPDTVSVGARISKIGNTSLTYALAVYSHEQRAIVIDGEAVCVAFNYQENRSISVPETIRESIKATEGWNT